MNDRELLELAAKAYSDPTIHAGLQGFTRTLGYDEELGCDYCVSWNPLIEDGDALRLAVKLNLEIQIDFNEESAKVYVDGSWPGSIVEEELGELDRYQATRRAIVRAAAEIGRTMP